MSLNIEEKSLAKLLVCWQILPSLPFAKENRVQLEHSRAAWGRPAAGRYCDPSYLEMTGLFCYCLALLEW